MKLIKSSLLVLLAMFSFQSLASVSQLDVAANESAGIDHPISIQAVSGESEGNKLLSFTSKIGDSIKGKVNEFIEPIGKPFHEWSYSRGVGKIPNMCPAGSSKNAGLCAENCPSGYDSVAGVCWQQCPQGYSDGGALCTKWKWWPKTIAKKSWVQPRKAMQCKPGMNKEAGLCYEPCADTFVGAGPLCWGSFGGIADQSRIRDAADRSEISALANAQGGIVVPEGLTPELKTDLSFAPVVCSLDGLGPVNPVKLGALGIDKAGDAVVGAISGTQDPTAWFVPSLSQTVLFDFSADTKCEDDGVKLTAGLSFKPMITVQASTKMFDSALHNLAGVDLGVMQISVYELLPFRIYGTVGTDIGTEVALSSTIDRSQPPVIINGVQHANVTNLDVTPEMNVWLSAQAYLRVTSILSFIPDLVQIGVDFKLWIMELTMPYSIEEGVRVTETGAETYKTERLTSVVESGNGYVDSFLKILGIELDVFPENADVSWKGVKEEKVLMDKSTVTEF